MSVKPKPIAIGAKPAGARRSVAPKIMIKKKAVRTTSIMKAEPKPNLFGDKSPKPLVANPPTPLKPAWP